LARRADGQGWVVLDVQRFRRRSFEVEELVKQAAYIDSPRVVQHIEQEGGASGKSLINHYQRNVLTRFAVRGDTPSGDKTTRARPVAAKAEAGMVSLVRAPWNQAFLDELEGFPDGNHDDQVDAFSGAFIALEGRARWVPAPNASSHA
jgi:predicted phage terminase large subunit-like protein